MQNMDMSLLISIFAKPRSIELARYFPAGLRTRFLMKIDWRGVGKESPNPAHQGRDCAPAGQAAPAEAIAKQCAASEKMADREGS